jgi:hypothetical protein
MPEHVEDEKGFAGLIYGLTSTETHDFQHLQRSFSYLSLNITPHF